MIGTIHCYAEGGPSGWEAVCLDFDVAAQGDTLEEAISSLTEAVALYLETVGALPEEERRRFYRRRAPLGLWLRWGMH